MSPRGTAGSGCDSRTVSRRVCLPYNSAILQDGGPHVTLSIQELARDIGAELVGNADLVIDSAGTLEDARAGQVSFLSNPKYVRQLETTHASAVVVSPHVKSDRVALLKAKDPYYAFRQAVIRLHGFRKHPHQGIHPAAHVDPTASVGEGCIFYPGVYVGAPRG